MLETTRDKADRLITADVRKKLQDNGLTVVDRADFEMVMAGYYESQRLKRKLAQLERERGGEHAG